MRPIAPAVASGNTPLAATSKEFPGYFAKLVLSEDKFELQASKTTSDKFNEWKSVATAAVVTKQEFEALLGVTVPALQESIGSLVGEIKQLDNAEAVVQALSSYLKEQKTAVESVIANDPPELVNGDEALRAAEAALAEYEFITGESFVDVPTAFRWVRENKKR